MENNISKKVLIVIDMQNDFVTGVLGTNEAIKIIPNIKDKLQTYVKTKQKIIFTRDSHDDDYLDTQEGKMLPIKHCVNYTEGWQICKEFSEFKDYCNYCIDKFTFGYEFWNLDYMEKFFSNIEEIELCGVCTDICVISNAILLKTYYPEIKITVDASCCAGVTPEKHRMALEVMKSCQIHVIGEWFYNDYLK